MRRAAPVVFSLTCVRHGETQANREHRIQGHLDIPLSDVGEMQSFLAGENLQLSAYTRVYTSDLKRAYVTCKNILEKNNLNPPTISVDTRLRERNFGELEGKHFEDWKSMAAAEGLEFYQYNPNGAETLGDLQIRMVAFFKELCQSVHDKSDLKYTNSLHGSVHKNDMHEENLESLKTSNVAERILVVSHGAALKQLYIHFHKTLGCNVPEGGFDIVNKLCPNTGISEYIIRYSPKSYTLECVRFHDASHLDNIEAL